MCGWWETVYVLAIVSIFLGKFGHLLRIKIRSVGGVNKRRKGQLGKKGTIAKENV